MFRFLAHDTRYEAAIARLLTHAATVLYPYLHASDAQLAVDDGRNMLRAAVPPPRLLRQKQQKGKQQKFADKVSRAQTHTLLAPALKARRLS